MQWLKNILKRRSASKPKDAEREKQAKGALETLRREELAICALPRRGEPMGKAPGQVYSGHRSDAPRTLISTTSRPTAVSQQQHSDAENLPLSMAVGVATKSVELGYLAGGSIAGAALGAAISSDHCSISEPSSSDSYCSRSDSGTGSNSWD